MAIPTFVASSAASINTASATVTCTYPAGSASGDLLVMLAGFQRSTTSGTQTLATPSGWTLLDTQQNSSAYGMVSATYWRFRGAETSVSVVCSNATSEYGSIQIHAFNGDVDQTNPINVSAIMEQSNLGTSSTNRTAPSVTTTSTDCAISVFASITSLNSGRTFTWPGATKRTDAYVGANADLYYTSATSTKPTAGATGTYTITPSNTVSESHSATVAIQPSQFVIANDTDTGWSAESASVKAIAPPVTDTGSATEAARIGQRATDAGSGLESATVTAAITGTDTGSTSESASVKATIPVADTGSAAETAYVINLAAVTDSGSGAETAYVTIYAADTGVFTDIAVGIGLDSGTFTESQRVIIVVSDSFSASESAFSSQSLSAGDAGSATEAAAVAVRATDTGAASETQQIAAAIPGADTGSATESARVTIRATDSGSATEAAAVRIPVTDTGSAVESASIRVTVFATDTGSALESASVVVISTDTANFVEYAFKLVSGMVTGPRIVHIYSQNNRTLKIQPESRRIEAVGDFRMAYMRSSAERTINVGPDKRTVRIEAEA